MSNKKEMAAMTTTAEAHALVPKLRFPEFLKTDGWRGEKLEKLVTTVNPPVKLQTSSYLLQGKFPIIDQSQDTICGWTNDESTLITESLPLIVFGDHTCTLKFVAKPFAQGADGIKIIKAKPVISAAYLFQSLNHSPLVMEDYKRHFSILKERVVYFPDVKTGEQQKIADCFSSIDELITLESQKLDTLKRHKKGLMQQLFPAEGETIPKLRFPEFKEEGSWQLKPIGEILSIGNGRDHKHLSDGDVPVFGSGGYMRSVSEYLHDGESICIGRKGTIDKPFFLSGKFWTVDTLFYTHSFKKSLPRFVYALFQRIEWLKHNEAGGVPSLSKANIEKIEVLIPELEEQKKIADCLTSFDDRIAAQNQKIEIFKTHKKGLMQQLFPAPDGFSAAQAGNT